MAEDQSRAIFFPNPNRPLTGGDSARVTPEEIYREIDKVKSEIRETPPGLLARLTDPNAKKMADALAETKLEVVESRRILIRGMRDVIHIYIETHKEDIKVRQRSYLLPRVNDLIGQLSDGLEASILEMLRLAAKSAAEIAAIGNLPEDLRRQQTEAAYRRALAKQDTLQAKQLQMIEEVTTHLRVLMGS